MYNTDFLPQLEASRKHLFGSLDSRESVYRINHYTPPIGVVILECVEAPNGEWVPKRVLEGKVGSE